MGLDREESGLGGVLERKRYGRVEWRKVREYVMAWERWRGEGCTEGRVPVEGRMGRCRFNCFNHPSKLLSISTRPVFLCVNGIALGRG